MRPIGGELEQKELNYNIYYTDSGRSSLRLFIKNNKDKKFLLPNFLCEIIEKILISENIEYEYYDILPDLEIDIKSIQSKEFDVLYLINYFGQKHKKIEDYSSKIIIEDNVFCIDFENTYSYPYWYSFNSFRKITSLSDGSLIKTNLDINDEFIKREEAPFVQNKIEAKRLKKIYRNGKYNNHRS